MLPVLEVEVTLDTRLLHLTSKLCPPFTTKESFQVSEADRIRKN